MSASSEDARTELWRWVRDAAEEIDPEQRTFKCAWLDGMLLACTRTGLLDVAELDEVRAVLDGAQLPPPPGADPDAARAHLEDLLGKVPQLSRSDDPEGAAAGERFHAALEAFAGVGILDATERRAWAARALRASAPWLDDEFVDHAARSGSMFAVGVPATTAEEEAQDAAFEAEWAPPAPLGAFRCALVARPPVRHDGLVVAAALLFEAGTELVLHHIAPASPDDGEDLDDAFAFHPSSPFTPPTLATNDGAAAPATGAHPSLATSSARDGEHRVTVARWRYAPVAADTTSLTAVLDDARWPLA